MPRRVLILGGARSGKSRHAEGLLGEAGRVDYAAPGPAPGPDDPEWAARVAEHRARRPPHWRTHETTDLAALLTEASPAPLLIDCLGTWLTRIMDETGAWEASRPDALAVRFDDLLMAWRDTPRQAVAVTNEVGSGIVPATASGRRFRDELGRLNAAVAAESDEVWLLTAGIPQRLK